MRASKTPRLCRWLRRRLSQLRHIEPSNVGNLPHALCPLRLLKYRASAQVHVLAHADVKGDRPDRAELSIPSYNGFHAGLNVEQGKSKACFHMSESQPPNKSVVKDIMDKLTVIIATKRMPFAFLMSDHPVYVLITLLKAENPNKYCDTVPFLGPFHTQCVMTSAIYKRYKGSTLEERYSWREKLLPGAPSIVRLKGKHFKNGLRCVRFMYESAGEGEAHVWPGWWDKGEPSDTEKYESLTRTLHVAQVALAEEADLESLITNIFTQTEASDMADYWRDFLSMTDALMQNGIGGGCLTSVLCWQSPCWSCLLP